MVTSTRLTEHSWSMRWLLKKKVCTCQAYLSINSQSPEWTEAYRSLQEALGLEANDTIPKLQRPQQTKTIINVTDHTVEETSVQKRKHSADEDVHMPAEPNAPPDDPSKRPKLNGSKLEPNGQAAPYDVSKVHAKAAAAYIPFLTEEMLKPPKMPTRDEMETVLLGLRKKALVEEYFGQ
jgi:pre-mRNA-splicing factor ISY1